MRKSFVALLLIGAAAFLTNAAFAQDQSDPGNKLMNAQRAQERRASTPADQREAVPRPYPCRKDREPCCSRRAQRSQQGKQRWGGRVTFLPRNRTPKSKLPQSPATRVTIP